VSKYATSAVAALLLAACKPSAPAPSAETSTTTTAATSTAATSTPAASTAATTAPSLGRGDAAPPFSLQGSDGKVHALSDDAGKDVVVVAWFPKAFTSG
jgi:hypothetical protein